MCRRFLFHVLEKGEKPSDLFCGFLGDAGIGSSIAGNIRVFGMAVGSVLFFIRFFREFPNAIQQHPTSAVHNRTFMYVLLLFMLHFVGFIIVSDQTLGDDDKQGNALGYAHYMFSAFMVVWELWLVFGMLWMVMDCVYEGPRQQRSTADYMPLGEEEGAQPRQSAWVKCQLYCRPCCAIWKIENLVGLVVFVALSVTGMLLWAEGDSHQDWFDETRDGGVYLGMLAAVYMLGALYLFVSVLHLRWDMQQLRDSHDVQLARAQESTIGLRCSKSTLRKQITDGINHLHTLCTLTDKMRTWGIRASVYFFLLGIIYILQLYPVTSIGIGYCLVVVFRVLMFVGLAEMSNSIVWAHHQHAKPVSVEQHFPGFNVLPFEISVDKLEFHRYDTWGDNNNSSRILVGNRPKGKLARPESKGSQSDSLDPLSVPNGFHAFGHRDKPSTLKKLHLWAHKCRKYIAPFAGYLGGHLVVCGDDGSFFILIHGDTGMSLNSKIDPLNHDPRLARPRGGFVHIPRSMCVWLRFFRNLAEQLFELHENGLVHNSIEPSAFYAIRHHTLRKTQYVPVIGNLQDVCEVEHNGETERKASENRGPRMPREFRSWKHPNFSQLTKEADTWAFGVAMLELLSGTHVLFMRPDLLEAAKSLRMQPEKKQEGTQEGNRKAPSEVIAILEVALNDDYKKRNMKNVLNAIGKAIATVGDADCKTPWKLSKKVLIAEEFHPDYYYERSENSEQEAPPSL